MDTTYERFFRQDNRWLSIAGQFSVVLLWPIFLIAAPLLVSRFGWWMLLVLIPVGTYLIMWVGLLRHEVWHKNFVRIDSRLAFRLLSYIIFLDPHPYLLGHGPHHTFIHTTRDPVLFCEGYEADRRARKRTFILEFIFGNAAWELASLKQLVRSGKVSRRAVLVGLPLRAITLVATAVLAWMLGGKEVLAIYPWTTLAVVWSGSQAARHVQWVEHLGILAEGSMEERSLVGRNMTSKTLFGWLFNLLTLQEAWNHTYHHIEPGRPLSSIDNVGPDASHIVINEKQYARVLWNYWKSL
jgi:fatty acid desaturase